MGETQGKAVWQIACQDKDHDLSQQWYISWYMNEYNIQLHSNCLSYCDCTQLTYLFLNLTPSYIAYIWFELMLSRMNLKRPNQVTYQTKGQARWSNRYPQQQQVQSGVTLGKSISMACVTHCHTNQKQNWLQIKTKTNLLLLQHTQLIVVKLLTKRWLQFELMTRLFLNKWDDQKDSLLLTLPEEWI